MKLAVIGTVALLAFAIPLHSQAEIYTFSGPQSQSVYKTFPTLKGGRYQIDISSTLPSLGGELINNVNYNFDYFDNDGNYILSNNYEFVEAAPLKAGPHQVLPYTFTTTPSYETHSCGSFCTSHDAFLAVPSGSSIALIFGPLDPDVTGGPSGNYLITISSVPEPATWVLSILGLATLGLALRRSRSPIAIEV